MPALVLLAGPNGAGKTTFINGFLRERAEAFQFVNPDKVAREEQSGKFLPPPGWKGRLITGTPGDLDDLKTKKSGKAA